ncbi:response regulator [Haloarchaeobius amylolyticus]|uniref:response regulator n=1 Tax=Haloarchaeobius amylolyticus TaxID=1198296 RepID=UPI00226DE700|nr:response regulator [Haloarchaeobius amylolyticus]
MKRESRPTVLIVDDEPEIADLHTAFLDSDYDVRTAYSGAETFDLLDETVDVVLLDRRMPGQSGDEVLGAIREAAYDCRVAMVTAVEPDFDVLELGFDDYLVKPAGRDGLRDLVDRLLRRADYDERFQRHFALAAKAATLEAYKDPAALAESEEYQQLKDELAALDGELTAALDAMETDEVAMLFRG